MIKFITRFDSKSIDVTTKCGSGDSDNKNKKALWKCLMKFPLPYIASCNSWLFVIILLFRVSEIFCASNLTTTMTSTTYHATMLVPTASILSSMMKSKDTRVNENHNDIIGLSENNEDYLDEDSAEIYDDTEHLNYSGE